MKILLLHPGSMGAAVGAALVGNGHDVRWLPAGRSAATEERARAAGLRPVATLREGAREAALALSICPPDAAVAVARAVRDAGFAGTYVDGNAIAPASAARIEAIFGERYVDGGLIGPPPRREGATRFYLSGSGAPAVAALFDGSLLDARAIGDGSGAASALKMCYAAYTKGSAALLLGVRALARQSGVGAELLAEWEISQPGLAQRSEGAAKSVSRKAWRFAGEMREIAATFAAAGLPDGFHVAAAALYDRMAPLKDAPNGADVEAVMRRLAP